MNRLIADSRTAGRILGVLRCCCGLLCCAVAVAAIAFAKAGPAHADAGPSQAGASPSRTDGSPAPATTATWPRSRECREIWWFGHRYVLEICPDRWRWGGPYTDRDERLSPGLRRRSGRTGREHAPIPRRRPVDPAPAPEPDGPPKASPSPEPSPERGPQANPTPVKPSPAIAPPRAVGEDPQSRPLPPTPLLGLLFLLLPVAAIGLTLRQRALAAAAATGTLAPPPPLIAPAAVPRTDPAVPDPFTGSLIALGGPGADGLARLITLSALGKPGGDGLVVLPRADAMALFGLDDDELLDEPLDRLFLPGTLDAALAYLETELRIRDDAESTGREPRLLLVADCDKEADRITGLFARHPGGLSAVILGAWPGEQAVADENGLVSAPPETAGLLPDRAPAMSLTEARHRLDLLARESRPRNARPKRRRHR